MQVQHRLGLHFFFALNEHDRLIQLNSDANHKPNIVYRTSYICPIREASYALLDGFKKCNYMMYEF